MQTTHRLSQWSAALLLACPLLSCPLIAGAHITLPPGAIPAGAVHTATFRVGHACAGASSTTGITLRAPEGFEILEVAPRPGWGIQRQGQEVRWTADGPQNALPAHERTTFDVTARLPAQAGTLWFKVLQVCDSGQVDWAEVPGVDGASEKPARPAARLEVQERPPR